MTTTICAQLEIPALIFSYLNGGEIVHIYGEAGTGKTTLALQLAIKTCAEKENVVWIEADGKYQSFLQQVKRMVLPEVFDDIAPRLLIWKISSFTDLLNITNRVDSLINRAKNVKLVVIDSITYLYRLDWENYYTTQKINDLLAQLSRIAFRKKIPIILINQVTAHIKRKKGESDNGKREVSFKPVAKVSDYADLTIVLEKQQVPQTFKMRIKSEATKNEKHAREKTFFLKMFRCGFSLNVEPQIIVKKEVGG
ncbi:MAG: AAA family ATPase [Asgard group archaeon]